VWRSTSTAKSDRAAIESCKARQFFAQQKMRQIHAIHFAPSSRYYLERFFRNSAIEIITVLAVKPRRFFHQQHLIKTIEETGENAGLVTRKSVTAWPKPCLP
jgi:hypothetical protein